MCQSLYVVVLVVALFLITYVCIYICVCFTHIYVVPGQPGFQGMVLEVASLSMIIPKGSRVSKRFQGLRSDRSDASRLSAFRA